MTEERTINISPATAEDLPRLIEVIKEGYTKNRKERGPESKPHIPDNYVELIAHEEIHVLVAREGNNIVGSVQFEDRDGKAYLSQMVTLPTHRSLGIGGSLLRAAEEAAAEAGFEVVQLTAMNEKGLPDYYREREYQEVGTKERPTYTLTIMEKKLT